VLSPSLNKSLYSVPERLQLARFQQACELEAKRRKQAQSERRKSLHLKRLLKERIEKRLVGQEVHNLRQMYKHVNEHREVRKRGYQRRDFLRQLRQHKEHCENIIRERTAERENEAPLKA
jgi:hypothetical protein